MSVRDDEVALWAKTTSTAVTSSYAFLVQTAAPQLPVGVQHVPALQLYRLHTLALKLPISVLLERDEQSFIARSPDVPQLFGFGDSPNEAVQSLKQEIESLWEDLQESDEYSDEFLEVKAYLATRF